VLANPKPPEPPVHSAGVTLLLRPDYEVPGFGAPLFRLPSDTPQPGQLPLGLLPTLTQSPSTPAPTRTARETPLRHRATAQMSDPSYTISHPPAPTTPPTPQTLCRHGAIHAAHPSTGIRVRWVCPAPATRPKSAAKTSDSASTVPAEPPRQTEKALPPTAGNTGPLRAESL
jgi:hypothetical protein